MSEEQVTNTMTKLEETLASLEAAYESAVEKDRLWAQLKVNDARHCAEVRERQVASIVAQEKETVLQPRRVAVLADINHVESVLLQQATEGITGVGAEMPGRIQSKPSVLEKRGCQAVPPGQAKIKPAAWGQQMPDLVQHTIRIDEVLDDMRHEHHIE